MTQRLRDLDRRVLREQDLTTADGWKREMSRWPWYLGVAGFAALISAVEALAFNDHALLPAFVPPIILMAFRAGQAKSEHDRLMGSDRVLGHRRPPGL